MDSKNTDCLEQQLYMRQKLDIIGQLSGGVSHSFNNHLTGIMGFANLIRLRSSEDKVKKLADEILDICKNSSDMMREFLAFTRHRPASADAIEVNGIVAAVARLLSSSFDKRIEIGYKPCRQSCVIFADAIQFQGTLLNLALNARDAMPTGGIITFSVKYVDAADTQSIASTIGPATDFRDAADSESDYVRIEISDTGCGFDSDVATRMFEPFFTTKDDRAGLGLPMTREFAQTVNGAIGITSGVGKGTTASLILPIHIRANDNVPFVDNIAPTESSAAQPTEKNAVKPDGGKRRGTILLADDDGGIRDSISAYLRGIGYSVFTATNGLDAVEKYSDTHTAIDLVILDMIMPRMDGKGAFVRLKEINPDIKAIGITGFSKFSVEELTGLGMKRVLHKPFPFEELGNAVAEYI
ncbi:MAG: response regulator [Chitinispirillales bacterium]|jgi:CheY-like chemotaxis protein|nr:response regulator [Chitinispirillales bacterium]